MPAGFWERTATIANGASLSGAVYVGEGKLVGITMPAAWTTAGLTFQVSSDGTTFTNAYDAAGAEVTASAAASTAISLDSLLGLEGGLWIKVRSGTNGSPVNQGAARTLLLQVRSRTGTC